MERFAFPFRAMAGENRIELYAPDFADAERIATAAIAEVQRIEAKYSRYRDDSVVTQINRNAGGAPVAVDAETAQLLDYAETCFQQSGGLFDITSGVLRRAWNFKLDRPPSQAEIAPLLPLIGWHQVERTTTDLGATVRLQQAGMEIDFGGFGKEYAADRAAAVLLDHGVRHAFVDLCGDVVVTGPHADGTPWGLGIRHPRREGELLASLPLAAGAVATSGDYERFLMHEGRRYSHILHPRTGQSVESFQSVTAFAPSCLVAGSLTTIAMLRGEGEGGAWLEASGAPFVAVNAKGELLGNC
ncbi:MAG: FAD:protein FMN transferase [Betaproteobacteria bacterium]|nr:FAD:protein FMN transferase [Betaproteobacteria bacterium]